MWADDFIRKKQRLGYSTRERDRDRDRDRDREISRLHSYFFDDLKKKE
jgi:hypothetical protein